MLHPIKMVWLIRAILSKPFFKQIGRLTYIGKPCFIEGRRRISIGNRTRIFPGVRMEAIGTGEINIGDNVAIEQNVQIVSLNSKLVIGNDVTIAGTVFITNEDHKYDDVLKSVMDQGYTVAETIINDGCFIGYGTTILQGTKLGKHCIVGSNSVVKGEFPNYSVIVGSPAKIIKTYDLHNNRWVKQGIKK